MPAVPCRPPQAASSASPPPRRAAWRSPPRASPTRGRSATPDGWALRRVLDRVGAAADRLGQRAPARALPAAVRAPRPVSDRAARPRRATARRGGCSSTGATRRRCCRWPRSRCCAGGWSAPPTTRGAGCGASQEERPELVAERARGGARRTARSPPARCSSTSARSAPARGGTGRTSSGRSSGCSGAGRSPRARRRGFERLYDLPERVLPPEVIATAHPVARGRPARAGADRRARAAAWRPRRDLRDYFRLPVAEARARVAELVEAGELWPVEVEGWSVPGYMRPGGAAAALACRRAALVGPFDSLVWERPRAERLFGFRYRIEIYVPGAQARARLLRAAVPARRPARGARRPEGRPRRRGAARPGRARGAGRAARDGGGARRRARARWRAGSGSAASRSSRGATWRRRSALRGSSRVSAATAAHSAASWIRLSSNAWATPWSAAPKKITPVTATPSAPPTCCIVESAPDAAPAWCGATPASTVVVSGVITSPMPAPISSSAGARTAIEPPAPIAATAAASSACPAASVSAPSAGRRRPSAAVSAVARSEAREVRRPRAP